MNRAIKNMQGARDDTGTEMVNNDDKSTIESYLFSTEVGN